MPIDPRDSRLLWGGPVRAIHIAGDREIRCWDHYIDAERWLTTHDHLEEWEIKPDHNPAWSLASAMLPGPDGRNTSGPVYDTPDGKPARQPS